METFFASIPILVLIVLMGVFKVAGDKSSIITLLITAFLAILAFHSPVPDTVNSFLYGMLKALVPILFIILMAIYSYNVLLQTKKIEVLKQQFSSISTDKSVQVLLITWGFGGLLEGMAGFGTAVAIPAAILISLGFRPVFSALVSLIANSVPTAFGAVGVPVIVLAQETGLPVIPLSTAVVLQLSVLMLLVPLVITFLADPRMKALPKNLLLSLLVGGVSLATQYLAARYIGAETPAIVGAIASIIVIVVIGKLTGKGGEKPIPMTYSGGEVFRAWAVYVLIMVLILFTSPLFPAVREMLSGVCSSTMSFMIGGEERKYTIQWLTQGGVLLFIGSFAGGLIQGGRVKDLLVLLWRSVVQLRKTIVTVICLVGFSSIMETSGMINQLAVALSAATGALYPLFAPTIGALGTFLTGSDTSANILFGKLQAGVAGHIGVDPNWLSAANTAGATGGKIISPQSIAIATSACDEQGKEGSILKAALPYALVYVVITGVVVYIFA
ncbi:MULTISPECIES: L-lactate permease [Butyricimonas]|uniref:L-lactate permease n=1 Tax=Butyricimonas TaxID=574697 RepID=UPI000B37CCB1|nr:MULTISPECIES: L-lactate permease [Butyricimonas]OUN63382.1 lactate permease [Butyricimonas sp. An62]